MSNFDEDSIWNSQVFHHCEERRDEAIRLFFPAWCYAALAMTELTSFRNLRPYRRARRFGSHTARSDSTNRFWRVASSPESPSQGAKVSAPLASPHRERHHSAARRSTAATGSARRSSAPCPTN